MAFHRYETDGACPFDLNDASNFPVAVWPRQRTSRTFLKIEYVHDPSADVVTGGQFVVAVVIASNMSMRAPALGES
jgi:hypothetical protein